MWSGRPGSPGQPTKGAPFATQMVELPVGVRALITVLNLLNTADVAHSTHAG